MTTLYLCEKPSQARALAKVLDAKRTEAGSYERDGVIVTHSYGSMFSLATPDFYLNESAWRLDSLPVVPERWSLILSPSARDQFFRIGELLKRAENAVIATDPDDAGEVIGRHILIASHFKGPIKRLWASALDKNSLTNALKNLRPLSETDSYYRAGMIRMKLDWLFGMNLTRLYSLLRGSTSKLGRVKTRILGELVNREQEIESFLPELENQHYLISNGVAFSPVNTVETPANAGSISSAKCVSVTNDTVELQPPSPFTLSALLSQVSSENGISIDAAYAAAQSLYEAQVISYPRTSSTQMPDGNAVGFANHHAIIPVGDVDIGSLGEAEIAVFRAVTRNYNMNLLGPATLDRQIVVLEAGDMKFNYIALEVKNEDDAGWLMLTSKEFDSYRPDGKISNYFEVGRTYPVNFVTKTKPTPSPSRFSEASLLEMMARKNIGTEATRVSEIGTLFRDGVATIENGEIKPSANGLALMRDLPGVVSGSEMSEMVHTAIAFARLSGSEAPLLNGAEKWLGAVIEEAKAQYQTSSSRSQSIFA